MPNVFTNPFDLNNPNYGEGSLAGDVINKGISQGWLSLLDILAPGSTALSSALDLNGQRAAQQQFENQRQLDADAYLRNKEEAQAARDWEKMMSDTSYQRAVEDLKKAGLNPYILMAQGLSGAPSYSGSSASTSAGSASKGDNKTTQALGLLAVFLRKFLTKGK